MEINKKAMEIPPKDKRPTTEVRTGVPMKEMHYITCEDFKIVERKGTFIVYILKKSSSLFGLLSSQKWTVAYKNLYTPAHFNSLKEARKWIKLMKNPDVEHSIE